jgi:TolA-binding protein
MNVKTPVFLSLVLLTGCSSAKQAIGTSAQGINTRSGNSLRAATEIQQIASATLEISAVQGDPIILDAQEQISNLASSIISDQTAIQESTVNIQSNLHRVEDKTPWWANLMSNLAIAGIVIGIIVLLWQTGLGMLIKRACWALGWFIPKSTMRSAAADMKVLNRDNEMAHREAIAIRRSSDPAYEAARRKLKRKAI